MKSYLVSTPKSTASAQRFWRSNGFDGLFYCCLFRIGFVLQSALPGYSQCCYGSGPQYCGSDDDVRRCPHSVGRLLQGHSCIPYHSHHAVSLQHQRWHPHRCHLVCSLSCCGRKVQRNLYDNVDFGSTVRLQIHLYIEIYA